MKKSVQKAGLEAQIQIDSAATSQEEIGCPVDLPIRQLLSEHGIDCSCKTARRLQNGDYDKYDLLIGMDQENLHDMYRICGGDFDGKMHLLTEYTGQPDQKVVDSWCTGNFEATWKYVLTGCQELLRLWRREIENGCVEEFEEIYIIG